MTDKDHAKYLSIGKGALNGLNRFPAGHVSQPRRPNDIPCRINSIDTGRVQKSYFLLPKVERQILNIALEQYQSGQSDPILIGGSGLLTGKILEMSKGVGRRRTPNELFA